MNKYVYSIGLCSLAAVLILTGCKSRMGKSNTIHVENSPGQPMIDEKPEDSVVFLVYTPKATFTTVAQMEAQMPSDTKDFTFGVVNDKFLQGCYYTGETSTAFLASFAERWNKTTFLRRFVNAKELFERENSNVGDSLTTETVRGKMPMLPNEYQLAFRNASCRPRQRSLSGC